MNYNQKVVVITGGSSGIGKALVDQYLLLGAKVATCGRSLSKLETAFDNKSNQNLLLYEVDVAIEQDCYNFIDDVLEKWGHIDILINNAGISMRATFLDLDLSVLKQLMDINFWGTVYCTKRALPSIVAHKGVVVGVSSIAGYRGLPARTGYSASKFAVQGFLESLRTELLYSGAHIMWVSPGYTKSNIRNAALNDKGHQQSETPLDENKLMTSEQVADNIIHAIEKRKRSVVMTLQGKLAVWVNKLFPSFADKKVFDVIAKEPNSPFKKP